MRIFISVFFLFFISTHTVFASTGISITSTGSQQSHATIQKPSTLEFSVFARKDCVHCIALEAYLKTTFTGSIQPKYYMLEDPKNYTLYESFTEKNGIAKATPIILIGNTIIEGFQDGETTGKIIEHATKTFTGSSYFENNIVSPVKQKGGEACSETEGCSYDPTGVYVNIPWMGAINLKDYSLLVLASLLGFVDGFNPCAMWVLVMFLTILAQTGSRKKMFQIAGIFIIAEAIMYFAILNAWYKTWDFVKLDHIVTPLIGFISVTAGLYFLYEFWTNKDGECKVTSTEHKRKTTEKIKSIVNAPMTIGIFFTTIGIAFSVNIIEFACSVGIPQAFTKLLEMSPITFMMKQMYISVYTLFYMFDDFIVFGIALYAFQYLHLTTKYTRYCLAIGGLIMLILGYFFLFNPIALKMLVA